MANAIYPKFKEAAGCVLTVGYEQIQELVAEVLARGEEVFWVISRGIS